MLVFAARWFLLASLVLQTLSAPLSTVDIDGGVQFNFRPASEPSHAVTFEQYNEALGISICSGRGPKVVTLGLVMTFSNLAFTSDGTQADISLTGSCPAGYELPWSSKSLTCSYSTGWTEDIECVPVTCLNSFPSTITSSNCTNGELSVYQTVCSTTCLLGPAVSGSPVSVCDSNGQWATDLVCPVNDLALRSCGIGNEKGLGSNTDTNYISGSTYDVTNRLSKYFNLVTAFYDSFCGVTDAQEILCAGSSHDLALGRNLASNSLSDVSPLDVPIVLGAGETFVKLAAGYHTVGALTSLGKLYIWGNNQHYQGLQGATMNSYYTPLAITGLDAGETVKDFTIASYTTVVLTNNNRLFGGGRNDVEELGVPAGKAQGQYLTNLPETPASLPSGVEYNIIVISETKNVYVSGMGPTNRCLTTNYRGFAKPGGANANKVANNVLDAACHGKGCAFVTEDSKVFFCGTAEASGTNSASATPQEIPLSLFGCPAGKGIQGINSNRHEVMSFWGDCNPTKVFGIDSYTSTPGGTCSTTSNKNVVFTIATIPGATVKYAEASYQNQYFLTS